MYIIKYIKYGSEEYNQTLKLRNDVMRKPLGRNIFDEDFSCEENQTIIGAFETNTMVSNLLIGCAVLSKKTDGNYMVEYICVDTALQKKGVGTALMQCLEKIAADNGANILCLDARIKALGFYKKLGFETKGKIFNKEIAPGGHIYMEKPLLPKSEHHHNHISCGSCGCGHHN